MSTHEIKFCKQSEPEMEMRALASFLAAAAREGIATNIADNGSGEIFVRFNLDVRKRKGGPPDFGPPFDSTDAGRSGAAMGERSTAGDEGRKKNARLDVL